MSYIPRPRQQEAIDKMVKFLKSKSAKKGIFVYPTSFGKSIVIANVASKFKDKYFINVSTSKELVQQNYDKYISYGFEADLCSASLGSRNVGKVTFATIGTLVKQVSFFKNKEVVILCDENHIGGKKGSQLDKFFKGLTNAKLIGTTATPFTLKGGMSGSELKMMNRDKSSIYSSIEDLVQIQEVVEQGYWSKLDYVVKDIDEEPLELNKSGTDYTDESLKAFEESNHIDEMCIEEVENLISEGRKSIIVFVPSIETAKQIAEKQESFEAIYSGMPPKDRDRIISDFKQLKVKCIINVSILSVGFDHPKLDGIIVARPTNSITFWYQGLGRGVRIHKDKKDCKVIDLSGNYNKFGRIEDINFENDKAYGGWAAFSGDRLLTNYPLGSEKVPTKQSLKEAYERKKNPSLAPLRDMEMSFGKHKGKKISELAKDFKTRGYLNWMLKEIKFENDYMKSLKNCIEGHLKLPSDTNKNASQSLNSLSEPIGINPFPVGTSNKDINVKEVLVRHTDNFHNFADLKDIF